MKLLLRRARAGLCLGPHVSTRGANGRTRFTGTRNAPRSFHAWVVTTALALMRLGAAAGLENGGFESDGFHGWTAASNWVVVDHSCSYYSGWTGRYWAWSGGAGEPATGVLRSRPFVLDKPAVRLLISGWSSIHGTGLPRRWNYVTLNLESGREIDRVYAPDTTAFVPALLDGSKHRGQRVYLEAVDDADQATFSMLCLDDVRTADLPPEYTQPLPRRPRFDPRKSIRLEDERWRVEVSRANGTLERLQDRRSGLDLILEPRLAGNYRFALPIAGREPWQTIDANWIVGRDQRLSSHRLEGRRLILRWDGPLENYLGQAYAAAVTVTIELQPRGVVFRLRIDSPASLPVGEVYFPVIGGIEGLGTTPAQLKSTRLIRPTRSAGRLPGARDPRPSDPSNPTWVTADIFRLFENRSWLGDQGPEQFYAYPDAGPPALVGDAPRVQRLAEPWFAFHSPKAGRAALCGALDPADRRVFLRLELVPASSGTPREDGNWPRPEELRGLPAGVEVSWVDLAGHPPGGNYEAAPVFLEFLDGDGPDLSAAYARWKRSPLSGFDTAEPDPLRSPARGHLPGRGGGGVAGSRWQPARDLVPSPRWSGF